MRHRPKTSDHLRMLAARARGLQTRLDSLSDRPPALHQNHWTMDCALARPQPQIPPLPTLDPSPRIQDLLDYFDSRADPIFLG
jgi:hypothetical protein